MKKIRTDTYLKIVRIFIWIFIIFIFYRGVIYIARGDRSIQIRNTLRSEMNEYKNEINNKNEIESFTSLFVREYMTYNGDINEYQERLNKFVDFEVIEFNFSNLAVNYIQVIKSEKVKEKIINVDCLININYLDEKTKQKIGKEFVLRVPIYTNENSFVVKNYPFVIAKKGKAKIQKENKLPGKVVNEKEKNEIYKTINNFLVAYMEGNKTDMGYFMLDKNNIKTGLGNSFSLKSINNETFVVTKNKDFYYVDCNYECEPFLRQHLQFKLVLKDEKYLVDEFDSVIGEE